MSLKLSRMSTWCILSASSLVSMCF